VQIVIAGVAVQAVVEVAERVSLPNRMSLPSPPEALPPPSLVARVSVSLPSSPNNCRNRLAAVEDVVADAAVDLVVAAKREDGVIAARGEDAVVAFGAGDRVVAIGPGDDEIGIGEVCDREIVEPGELDDEVVVVKNAIVVAIRDQEGVAALLRVAELGDAITRRREAPRPSADRR
jgi:hypothetical protein